jgi:hypothetical protein
MDKLELTAKLEAIESEAVALMTAKHRTPEELRKLNLLEEEALTLKAKISMERIKERLDEEYGPAKKENQVSVPRHDSIGDCLGYLVTHFGKRADIPEGAVLTKMLPEVVRNLAALGLHEPVCLQSLSGKWWLAHVDAAYDDSRMESGCGMFTRVVSTEGLVRGYDGYYCEVAAGPFDCKEDVK